MKTVSTLGRSGFSALGKGMNAAARAGRSFAGALKSAGMVAASIAIPLGLVAANVIEVGGAFEEAITAVGAVGLQTREQIAPLEAEAKHLGETTKFTATEAANGMEIMAKAGFKNGEILSGINGILNAAAASGTELAETADHVSNVLKGMGLAASEASRVADVLSLASSRTNSTIGSLGESMRNVAATARDLKIPLEQTVAGVALLQDVGLDASVAGSAMNTMLTKLAAPTDSLRMKMHAMGVKFEDAKGNMLPFTTVLANLAKGGKKAGGDMKRVAFFSELVGLRGQKAASNLSALFTTIDKDTGLNKVEALAKALESAEGTAEQMANLRMDNLRGDWTLMLSALDGVKNRLFEVGGSGLRRVVKGFTDWLDTNKELIGQKFDKFVKDIVPEIKQLSEIFSEAFVSQVKEVSAALGEFGRFDKSGLDATNPTLVELATNLGKMTAIILGVTQVFVGLSSTLISVGSSAFSVVSEAFNTMIGVIGSRVMFFSDWFDNLKAIFNAGGLSIVEKAFKLGKEIVRGLVKGIKEVATLPSEAIYRVGKSTLGSLANALGIHSPSRPAAKIGAFTDEGLVRGVIRGLPKVVAAGKTVGRQLIGSIAAGASGDRTAATAPGYANQDRGRLSPQLLDMRAAAISRSVEEKRTENIETNRLIIEDRSGMARMATKPSRSSGIKLQPSGAF